MSRNISPEIEAALEEGRAAGLREAAAYLRGANDMFVPYVVRGLNSALHGEEDESGWAPMSSSAKKLLSSAAKGVLRLINHEEAPACAHVWAKQAAGYSVCAACGERDSDTHAKHGDAKQGPASGE